MDAHEELVIVARDPAQYESFGLDPISAGRQGHKAPPLIGRSSTAMAATTETTIRIAM
jgi:hypothetical protein